jgi:hypothetical protein
MNNGAAKLNLHFVKFDVFTAVTMKIVVFWDVTSDDGGSNFLRKVGSYNSHMA